MMRRMSKGFAVSAILSIIFAVFAMLFIIGIAGNWKPLPSDVLGVMSFFEAVKVTFGEFISITNLMMWTMIFFAVQGIFLYVYYKLGRFLFVRIPEMRSWYEQFHRWFKRY